MVPTDTLDRGGYMGGRCVALNLNGRARSMAGQIGHPAIYAGAMTGRPVRVLLVEHALLESARFDQCQNRFSKLLYSTARPDAPRETSGEVRATSGRTSPCGVV